MASFDLIDTTEMYLKTIYEMEEDGVTPLRARIVERLGHSGPTVSQTIARMERDNLVTVRDDRRLELTDEGRGIAVEVMRKHRLAERLLVDVIGLSWTQAHDEACRWEHVMSAAVEDRLEDLLAGPEFDPYGNPVPGRGVSNTTEVNIETALEGKDEVTGTIVRIGEPIQAEPWLLKKFEELSARPGAKVWIRRVPSGYQIGLDRPEGGREPLVLEPVFAAHLFVTLP